MEESNLLRQYCTRIANILDSNINQGIDIHINEAVSRLDIHTRSAESSAISSDPSVNKDPFNTISEVYGSRFYHDGVFRSISSACALSINRYGDSDNVIGWSKLRLVVTACLLNPYTSADVTREVPDIALSIVVDLFQRCDIPKSFILERLLLSWRLRHDTRLRRVARSALCELLREHELEEYIRSELSSYKDGPRDIYQYKLRLIQELSTVLKLYGKTIVTQNSSDIIDTDITVRFQDLHINISCPEEGLLSQHNLVCIGQRVSYLRSRDIEDNSDFVELPYSSDVLSSMLCHLDVSIGSIVSGESCKEFYIRELARRVGIPQDSISRIYTDETTDVKSLIGQWICTDKVGEFKFNYGILSTAMRSGRWLIFDENLSESVGCLIYSICELGYLTIPELNEVVEATNNFHLFITTKNASKFTGTCRYLPITYVPTLSESDCIHIVSKRWPSVSPICADVVSTFFSLRDQLREHRGFNMSDLFKIVYRLSTSGSSFDGYISSPVKGVILESFYCVLLAGISCQQLRRNILGDIAERFNVLRSASYELLPLNQIKESGNTSVHLKVLNQLMSCYLCNEPVLLVGETGTGKTAIVQHFAKITDNTLKVYVFSEQSEAEDLIGGFYPDNISDVCANLFVKVLRILLLCCVINDTLVCFLDHLLDLFRKSLYRRVLRTLSATLGQVTQLVTGELESECITLRGECNLRCGSEPPIKQPFNLCYLQQPLDSIPNIATTLYDKYTGAFKSSRSQLQFKFEDGLLIRAMREGWWILLDEINLAPSDLLQRFVGILSTQTRKFELYECGNRIIDIHENFRLFACMNPPTVRMGDFVTFSSGKKELPHGFRSHMTEIFVDEIDTVEDISLVVGSYVSPDDRNIPSSELSHFYMKVLRLCRDGALEDGSFKSPTFTLRNLVRTLYYMNHVMKRGHRPIKEGREAFLDGALSSFASSLGRSSYSKVVSLLPSIPRGQSQPFEESADYVRVEGYWIRRGNDPIYRQEHFIVTPNISKNLRRLCCILSGLRVPLLLEGPTAAGKTSLVQYLCSLTGHRCVRINNHEHTDLSEYLGQFVFDAVSCQLKFNYGPIVTAMKEGHWVILDELNLAPSQVLEAINRILDDNREIYVPETGETIRSHPEFMIFATQNPANSIYGGRKQLSKAFCNRFVQLYIEGLDAIDLQQVLHQRCKIPLSRAEKIVSTFQNLQLCPMNSMAFQRHSVLITLRDLIRWANRVRADDSGLAYYGWCVIAEKLRDPADKELVREVLERCCLLSKPSKPKHLVIEYGADHILGKFMESSGMNITDLCIRERYLCFDGTTTRLLALLLTALENREPVLLVGETGIGKTTICQLLAKLQNRRLNILNLSKNSEASDFIGSFRPIRGLKSFHANMTTLIEYFEDDPRYTELVDYMRESMALTLAQIDRKHMLEILGLVSQSLEGDMDADVDDIVARDAKRQKMKTVSRDQIGTIINNMVRSFSNVLFEWVDGPLTSSMEHGDWFLADEISLAEDAVLEKMNSVLECESTLTIPEAGGSTLRVLRGHADFRFLATMNPAGDHGKRELSPALLNRFTVIYIPTPEFETFDVIRRILDNYGHGYPDWIANSMADITRLHNELCPQQKLTLRDVIKWSEFMSSECTLDSFIQGAHVVLLDNMAPGSSGISLKDLLDIVSRYKPDLDLASILSSFMDSTWVQSELQRFDLASSSISSFTLGSKNTLSMVGKILRALKVDRPILLEGEPGVGKSASISALATLHGTKLIRVNLSEHTDIMDLFGSDIPSAGAGGLKFIWHNGPVLDAAVNGYWVVLDELNLANQQVLEGLNALLDHRRETFIPELDRFIKCHDKFRLFASQNPALDGGGRKHLPKSFLNRFTKIYYHSLGESDYCAILSHLYPQLRTETITLVVTVLFEIRQELTGKGWDWNLRDCLRLCDTLVAKLPSIKLEEAFRFAFMSRLNSREGYEMISSILFAKGRCKQLQRAPNFVWPVGPRIINGLPKGNVTNVYAYEPIWMQSQEDVYHVVCMAAYLNFPVLVVGPVLSGKRSVVKNVATMCNQHLTEITMLPCFDTSDLLGGFEQVGAIDGNNTAGNFRWVDSPLVESIESGRWVLLTRIHNANPAILDRLNSLLEVGGSLALNESGDCNRVVMPHPNFRIFMTTDAAQVGKISRAFRNRCLEVHMNFPESMRPDPQFVPRCTFMAQLTNSISSHITNLLYGSEEGNVVLNCEIGFKCATLIDGARLLKSLRDYSWPHCVRMSLCSCVLGSYITHYAPGSYTYHMWSFLKQWSTIDERLDHSALAASRVFPPEIKPIAYQVLACSIDWCERNMANCEAIQLVTRYLERCNRFDSRLYRDVTVTGLYSDSDSLLWYLLRSYPDDYEKRYSMLDGKYGVLDKRHYIDRFIKLWMDVPVYPYELQAVLHMLITGSFKLFDQLGTPGLSENLLDMLLTRLQGGNSVLHYLSMLQFLIYLLVNETHGRPDTIEYIVRKVYEELLENLGGPKCISNPSYDFLDYSVPFFGGRIRDDLTLSFELHRHGVDSMVLADDVVTTDMVLAFIDAYVDTELSGTLNTACSIPLLSMRRVDTPNVALSMFFMTRLRFVGSWICHQLLVGDIDRNMLAKVHEYSMEMLKLYIDLQNDLPCSSLYVVVSILISLRKLMRGIQERPCVYEIMLDSWSCRDLLYTDNDLDPVQYMVNLLNGHDLSRKQDICSDGTLKGLDSITAVMLFWDHVSKDNGLPSLHSNLKRIDSLRGMLSECVTDTQWSGLFATLCLVSPILAKVFNIDMDKLDTSLRSLYVAITREEHVRSGLLDILEPIIADKKVCERIDGPTAFISHSMVHSLASCLLQQLCTLANCAITARRSYIKDLWRLSGLLVISALPNAGMVITEIREDLCRTHRSDLSEQLQKRLGTFVALDTLADGECCDTYSYLAESKASLMDTTGYTPSLRYHKSVEGFSGDAGSRDPVAVMRRFQNDLDMVVKENLKLGPDFSIYCDHHCLMNLRRYLLRHYVLLPEMLRPVLVGLDCLSFSLSIEGSKGSVSSNELQRSIQNLRVSQRCMQFPYNLLKRVNKGDLLSLSARFYDSVGLCDVYTYVNCLIASVRLDLLSQVSMEPLKYAILILAGIHSRLKMERSEGQSMRKSLLQSCIAMAQKNVEKGVHDLFPSQQEIVRAIVRECGPIEEFETVDIDDEVSVDDPEQNRDIRRITLLCKVLTVTILSRGRVDSSQGNIGSEFQVPDQRSITRQINAALCLGLACNADTMEISNSEDLVLLLTRLMSGSEEHFGYRNADDTGSTSFYRSVDLPSCLKAWDIMSSLASRVETLLGQFESQQQLLDIRTLLTSMCKVKLPTMTQVLLVALLENLVARVHKWNSISHSAISLRDLTSDLENLILELRRRELQGWYSAIEDRVSMFREDAYSYLLYFAEMCSHMHDTNVPCSTRVYGIVEEIVEFVLTAPVAHFDTILDLLRSVILLYRDSTIATEVTLRTSLENTLCFLEFWQPSVDKCISNLKEDSRREVGELVKRINWSGNDYISISALLQKQKTQMSSVIRRFQEGLMQPWSMVYSASAEEWYEEPEVGVDDTCLGDIDMDSGKPSCSELLGILRSNIDYIRSNKNDISRVQITRMTSELGRILGERGYSATPGHDSSDWLRWIDFGINMCSNGCTYVDDARANILRSLHIIRELDASFNTDKNKFDMFSRNVDLNIYGYLVTMLRAAHQNMVTDVAEYQSCTLSQCLSDIVQNPPIHEMDRRSFERLLSVTDDIYEAALQANHSNLLKGPICDPQSNHITEKDSEIPLLLSRIMEFRSWLQRSSEFRGFKFSTDPSVVLLSNRWLTYLHTFCDDVAKGTGYPVAVHPYFHHAASCIVSLLATAKPMDELPKASPREFRCRDPDLPLECLLLAQLINCISHVEPPADESEKESRDEWAGGTGLEDGTGAKNVSDDVDPDEGLFDNFAKEPPTDHGEIKESNPAVDIDMEFDGDILDLEGSRECSDIEEDSGGHNEEYEDLQKQQLDTDLVDDEPPLDDDGEPLDIQGVSMDATKDAVSDTDDIDNSERENEYTSEVPQQPTPQEPTEEPKEEPTEDLTEEPAGDSTNELDKGNNDVEFDGDEGQEPMDTDEVSEQQEETTGEPTTEDGVEPDAEATQNGSRREYEETPYGTEGDTGSNIRNEEDVAMGGNSYEEDSLAGSFWGDTTRSQGGSMVGFLDTIQRLENPSDGSRTDDLKMKNIVEPMTGANNLNENDSALNELDETSHLEGLSASMQGSMVHNIEEITDGSLKQEEIRPEKLSETVDPSSTITDSKVFSDMATKDDDICMDSCPYDDLQDDICVDTSAVHSGTAVIDTVTSPPELLSRVTQSKDGDVSTAAKLWRQFCAESLSISTSLCEQMRMILEPSLKSSLQGDYKTGKRISIKKLMAFIASNYQRDKIWLRRSKPSKRDYRVVLAIDNSRSMSVSNAGSLALKSFACIYQAMSVLDVGELSVCKFGGNVPELLLEMGKGEDPSRVIAGMTFDEESQHSHETGLPELLKYVLSYLDRQDERRKIVIIISDGKFNKEKARPWIQATISKEVVPLLVILDTVTSSHKSILQMKQVRELKAFSSIFALCACLVAVVPTAHSSGAKGVLSVLSAVPNIAAQGNALSHAFKRVFSDVDSGTNEINYDGGNMGAYYNFMYPDNDDYPWACVCNEYDLQLYREKKQPYARCRNQEDLSMFSFQANCDPKNSANEPF
ncbi:Midasin [Babesia sp. Xinjiang]|uniref:Midasin n=1 Tax=Babesia sp. Xinjiang TaxID=462227 RepID=UPI000A225413|nr:Midasin [Babesia sp. Xinjiang]ORM41180.1 Midasin [Babesia sp. Xinjiang]